MAVICVPLRNPFDCVITGVGARMFAHCMVPRKPQPKCCNVAVQTGEPDYTDLISGVGIQGVMSTLGRAGANADDFIWGVVDHLRGPDGPAYFERTFAADAHKIPGGVAETVLPGESPQSRWNVEGTSKYRGLSSRAKGWAVGAMDSMFNYHLGPGGVAQTGCAGIEGESAAAKRGEKPVKPPWKFPEDGLQDTYQPPGTRLPRVVWRECTEQEERGEDWGEPGGMIYPTYEDKVDLPEPLPGIITDERFCADDAQEPNEDRSVGPGLDIRANIVDAMPMTAGSGDAWEVSMRPNCSVTVD